VRRVAFRGKALSCVCGGSPSEDAAILDKNGCYDGAADINYIVGNTLYERERWKDRRRRGRVAATGECWV
jgi:hypothetical protein